MGQYEDAMSIAAAVIIVGKMVVPTWLVCLIDILEIIQDSVRLFNIV